MLDEMQCKAQVYSELDIHIWTHTRAKKHADIDIFTTVFFHRVLANYAAKKLKNQNSPNGGEPGLACMTDCK